jgi:hypothetical protein
MIPVPETTMVDVAFGARALAFMPTMSEIPDDFKVGKTDFYRFFYDLFYEGDKITNLEMIPREGVDPAKAFQALRVIAGSFEPKHEHKEAAFAYLAHEWFDIIAWDKDGMKKTAAASRDETHD